MRRISAALLTVLLCTFLTANQSNAQTATAVGDSFRDGLDTRHAASSFMASARVAGYTGVTYTNGRGVNLAWEDARSAQVFGYFGHARAGFMVINEGSTPEHDRHIYAGAVELERVAPIEGNRSWREYTPFADLDDVRLAVLAGCKTARTAEPSQNNFERAAKSIGIDALVTFQNDVHFPADCGSSCNYSGNYFWDRVGNYLQFGRSIGNSLSMARSDLIAKEGRPGGWDSYRVTGTVASPANVRLTPSGPGEMFTSQPATLSPVDLSAQTVSNVLVAEGVSTVDTQEGATYRRDVTTGRLIDYYFPTSTAPTKQVSLQEARSVALRFVEDHALDIGLAASPTSALVSHGEGESVGLFEWRVSNALALVEVDLSNGNVTYFNAARVSGPERFGEVTAEAAAWVVNRILAPGEAITSIQPYAWDLQFWEVTTTGAAYNEVIGPLSRSYLIDSISGDIVRITST